MGLQPTETFYCLACGRDHLRFPCEHCGACEVQALLPCLVPCLDGKIRAIKQALTPAAKHAKLERERRALKPWSQR